MSHQHHRRQRRVDPKHRGSVIPSATRQLLDVVGEYGEVVLEESIARTVLQEQLDAERERVEVACYVIAQLEDCDVERARSLIDELRQDRQVVVA